MAPCIYGSMHIWLHAYMAPHIYSSMRIWLHVYMVPCICSAHSPHTQLAPACSPNSSLLPAHLLAPYHPEVVGIPIHTKLFIGHWEPAGSELEGAGAGSEGSSRDQGYQGARGASWSELGLPEALGSQYLEILRGQGEQAGSKGSKLGAREASWK